MPNDLPDKPEEGDTKNAISGQAVDPPTRLHRVPADEESGLPAKTPPNLASGTNRDSPPISSCAPALHGDVAGYEILAELGRGGMGVVYKARHRGLNRIVALKMILAGGHASEVDLKRFVAEAEAVAALQHQNIVQVYEIGQHNALPYMALEYVGGGTLAKRLKGTPLPPRQAARLVLQLAQGMDVAHQTGIVHRDLKPGNVLLKMPEPAAAAKGDSTCRQGGGEPGASATGEFTFVSLHRGIPKITDFGLAKKVQAEASGLTHTGTIMGTPSYMAPEQAEGGAKRVGPAADIYALGAILYECLTGRPPFQGPTPLDTLMQVKSAEPVPPGRLQPDTPRDLETICLKCLNKEPGKRYGSAAALAKDLERYLGDRPILARPSGTLEKTWRWCRRNPVVATLTASVALLVLLSAIGSSIAAFLLENERRKLALSNEQLQQAEEKERLAKKDAVDKLWKSYLAQARAGRWSGQPGRRFDSLEALAKAAAIQPSLDLRNEAIACLALPDLRAEKKWQEFKNKHEISWPKLFAFDPTFLQYAHADAEGNIRVYSTEDDREQAYLPSPKEPAWLVQFSGDGSRLAVKYHHQYTPERNRVFVWDLKTKKTVLEVTGRMAHAAMDFSPDSGTFALGHQDGSVWLYDLAGNDKKRLFTGVVMHSLRFDAGGSRLALSSVLTPEVHIRDAKDGKLLYTLRHSGRVRGLSWLDDGSSLACACSDNQVYVWNMAAAPKIQALLKGHDHEVIQVAFAHRGGLLASTAWDSTYRLWDPFAGKLHLTAPMLGPLQFRDDDGRLGFFEVAQSSVLHRFYLGARAISFEVHFNADGTLLANGMPDGAQIWDLASQKKIAVLHKPKGIWSTLFHPDGKSVMTSGGSGLCRWPVIPDPTQPGGFRLGPAQTLNASPLGRACLSPDGRLLAVGNHQGQALIYDLDKPATPVVCGIHPSLISVAFSPDNRWLASGAWQGRSVIIWDARSGKLLHSLPVAAGAQVEFSPDGRLLVSATDEEICLWNTENWEPGLRIRRERSGPVAFSPRGDMLAIAHSLSKIRLLHPHSGLEYATLETPYPLGMSGLRFSQDGSQLAVATDYMTQLWDLRRLRQELSTLNLDWQQSVFPRAKMECGPCLK